jgi:hypothetical protein
MIQKNGYLFSSSQLIQLLDCIPSKQTQVSIIETIGPRLIDPKKYSNEIINRFRFAEEKEIVQSILKARAVTQNSNIYGAKKMIGGRPLPQRKMKQSADVRRLSPPPSDHPPGEPPDPDSISVAVLSVNEPEQVQSDPSSGNLEDLVRSLPSPSQESDLNNDSVDDGVADFSPATTNEEIENMIEVKPQLVVRQSLTLSSLTNSPPSPLSIQLTKPHLEPAVPESSLGSRHKASLSDDVESPDIIAHPEPVETDGFHFDSPVIDVVGTKTRVLSVHIPQPASKAGGEDEFLTQTEEFSFDERFEGRDGVASQSSQEPPSGMQTTLSLFLPQSSYTSRQKFK